MVRPDHQDQHIDEGVVIYLPFRVNSVPRAEDDHADNADDQDAVVFEFRCHLIQSVHFVTVVVAAVAAGTVTVWILTVPAPSFTTPTLGMGQASRAA